jgi:RNA polymerase sigma-70 factor, ECF subfamily
MANLHTMAEMQGRNEMIGVFERELYPLIDAVYSFAVRLSNDRTQADDLVQETFMRAWKSRDNYKSDTNARAWLFTICKNVYFSEYRKKKIAPRTVDPEEFVLFHSGEKTRNVIGYQTETELDWMTDEIRFALNALPEKFRVVVLLDMEDFTYEEISELADIKIGTVRSRLFRAREKMARQLSEYARQRGYNVADDHTNETAASAEGILGEAAAQALRTPVST